METLTLCQDSHGENFGWILELSEEEISNKLSVLHKSSQRIAPLWHPAKYLKSRLTCPQSGIIPCFVTLGLYTFGRIDEFESEASGSDWKLKLPQQEGLNCHGGHNE